MRLRAKRKFAYNIVIMKKRHVLLPLIPLAVSLLTGCDEKHFYPLTYGTYINQSFDTLVELSNDDLYAKMYEAKETFILAIHQGAYSEDCLCWTTFKNVIISYMNKYHKMIYLFDVQQADKRFDGERYTFFKKRQDSNPILVTFRGETPMRSYTYSSYYTESLFTNADALDKAISSGNIGDPYMYLVDDTYLKEKLPKSSRSLVLFVRRGCGDCNYVLPNVVLPYYKENKVEKELLVFDMQDAYNLSKKEGATEEEKGYYQSLKDAYGLSESSGSAFGYQQGVVPTIACYEKGVMKDAAVFFNDVITKDENDEFYISDSFYSEERVANSRYIRGASTQPVLKGRRVYDYEVMETPSGTYYWNQEMAARYHYDLFKGFLEYYLS